MSRGAGPEAWGSGRVSARGGARPGRRGPVGRGSRATGGGRGREWQGRCRRWGRGSIVGVAGAEAGSKFRLHRPRGRAPLRRWRVGAAGVTGVTSDRGSCRLRAFCPDPCYPVLRGKAAPVTIRAHGKMPGTARRPYGAVTPEPRALFPAELAAAPLRGGPELPVTEGLWGACHKPLPIQEG